MGASYPIPEPLKSQAIKFPAHKKNWSAQKHSSFVKQLDLIFTAKLFEFPLFHRNQNKKEERITNHWLHYTTEMKIDKGVFEKFWDFWTILL